MLNLAARIRKAKRLTKSGANSGLVFVSVQVRHIVRKKGEVTRPRANV